ncbi:MAG TPA: c-type cytochrome domain-containing protein [Methylomirabilota bacterium]|nr:c-type cytochrome domain-containing protein [Methylomirabilota bacterium]
MQLISPLPLLVALAAPLLAPAAEEKPVSFHKDIVPIFKKSCNGCHHPGKMKGDLDLTTYEAFKKGGKHGPAFKPGDAQGSSVIEEITGEEPSMPKEGDPLTKDEVALIARWIAQGAVDDTPAGAGSLRPAQPPVYPVAPVVSALAWSPDGRWLAVSGYHEVLLHSGDGSNLIARLLGESPRIESVAFSPDGHRLAVAASAPGRFGEIQIWDLTQPTATNALQWARKVATDAVFGISWAPDGRRLAVGGADKSVRVFAAAEGKELLKFDNHSDWVFATAFTTNGARLLSGSRDRAMKLIDAATGQFIDDINKLLEPVQCFARHPRADLVAYGGEMGGTRIYRISDNQGRTAANNDVNLVKELERLPGPVCAVAFSPDGETLAIGGMAPEVRLHAAKDGQRKATLKGHEGAIFALTFHPASNWVATAGFDGSIRIYETDKGELVSRFSSVPVQPPTGQRASAR